VLAAFHALRQGLPGQSCAPDINDSEVMDLRSELFGFHVQTYHLYEAILTCPLRQAYELVLQHVRRLDGLAARLEGQQVTLYSRQRYTIGLEFMLNAWDDGVEDLVWEIVRHHTHADELTRMRALQQGLSWLWPKFRETATVAQLLLATTIDGDTHLSLAVGWNAGASPEDIHMADRFIQLYFLYLGQLNIPFEWLTPQPSDVAEPPRRAYGPRADTLEKIQRLRALRSEHLRSGEVALTRTHACELIGITPAIVKKYQSELYDRWYDPSYREAI
jgi:hypothetical protein